MKLALKREEKAITIEIVLAATANLKFLLSECFLNAIKFMMSAVSIVRKNPSVPKVGGEIIPKLVLSKLKKNS